jgi:nitroreductase
MSSEAGEEPVNRTIEIILNRSSTKKFADTPVSRAQLESLLASATRAPDHGLLAPWRFTVRPAREKSGFGC